TSTVISFDHRMFFPLLPLLALLAGHALSSRAQGLAPPALQRAAMSLVFLAFTYAYVNVRTVVHRDWPRGPHEQIAARLARTTRDGSVLAWVQAHVSKDAVLLAADGQATAYVLDRPVVSLIEACFSDQRWDEAQVARVMSQFAANYLVL